MTIIVKRWIGSNGDVLIPLSQETYNDGNMISTSGIFYMPQVEETIIYETGSPMGLLLTLTYTV